MQSCLCQIFGELVQSSGPTLLHTWTRCVERLALSLIRIEGDPFNCDRSPALLVGEEKQLAWIETQLQLLERLGEANYLAQQVRS